MTTKKIDEWIGKCVDIQGVDVELWLRHIERDATERIESITVEDYKNEEIIIAFCALQGISLNVKKMTKMANAEHK